MKLVLYLFLWAIGTLHINHVDTDPPFSLVVFEGSDWCTNCIKLEHNILSNTQFLDYLNENNISLDRIDFPRWIKQSKEIVEKNNALAEQFNFQGEFPTIILVSSDSTEYVQIAHHNKISPEDITTQIEKYLSNSK